MEKLVSLDQLKVGTKIQILGKNISDSIGSISVKKIIVMQRVGEAEPYDHEILINRTRNSYFSMGKYLNGESWVKEVYVLSGTEASKDKRYIQRQYEKIKELEAQLKDADDAIHGLLTNAALDWYVDQFTKSEAPSGVSTGIAAKIHNRELIERAMIAYKRARQYREKYPKDK